MSNKQFKHVHPIEPRPVVEPSVEETDIPEESKNVGVGKVCSCEKLNVRKEASATAAVVCILPVGSEVMIDKDFYSSDFYKVTTEAGAEGFCMKRFVVTE